MTLGYRLPHDGKPIVIPSAVAQRAHDCFLVDEQGCHISTYSVASHGYAQIGWSLGNGKSQMVTAHRAAWVHVHGQIRVGLTVDHLCRVRPCVNVNHLRLLTNVENATDNGAVAVNPGVGRFCFRGHELVASPLGGHTYCRVCANARRRTRRRAARQAALV